MTAPVTAVAGASWLSNTDSRLRRAWHPVARSTEVGGEPRSVRLLSQDWVVVRRPDEDGGTTLAAFVDQATPPAGLVEHQGLVFLAPEPPLTELLDVPEADDDAFVHGDLDTIEADVGAGLMIDNFLDMSHFPFVHALTIGTEESASVDNMVIQREHLGMTGRSRHPFPNHEDPGVAAGIRPLMQERELTYVYRAPFSVRLRIDYLDAGGTNCIELYVQPQDEHSCRIYCSLHRNDLGADPDRMVACIAYEHKILGEDLRLQERYTDHRLPLDLSTEVHVKADRITVELRRILADLVRRYLDAE